jgi:hypothetical protein
MNDQRPAARICRALTKATALEEKARENPEQAPRLIELARKLRVGAAMLEAEVRAKRRDGRLRAWCKITESKNRIGTAQRTHQ